MAALDLPDYPGSLRQLNRYHTLASYLPGFFLEVKLFRRMDTYVFERLPVLSMILIADPLKAADGENYTWCTAFIPLY